MRVTLSNGIEVSPIALADLGDNDNYTHLCLDTHTPADRVTVEPGSRSIPVETSIPAHRSRNSGERGISQPTLNRPTCFQKAQLKVG
jgi:hypothetical protein